MNIIKKFETFNESKKEKITLNGYVHYLDREKQIIYDNEDAKNGIHYDIVYDNLVRSSSLSKEEAKELQKYLFNQ